MDRLIESEADDSSSSASSESYSANVITEQLPPAKIPLSTSILVEKLPSLQKELLSKVIRKQESEETGHGSISKALVVALATLPQSGVPEQQKQDQLPAKISIRLQSIGSTPAITPKVFRVTSTQTVSTIMKFVMKRLKLEKESIHLYIHNSFQINPDEILADLYAMFKVNDELIISYCNTVAFG